MIRFLIGVTFLLLFFSCQEKEEIFIPVIKLDNQDKVFTFTNKSSGFYLGRTHSENPSTGYGWIVNGINYLRDYQIVINNQILQRDSVQHVSYYPHQLIREYGNGLLESFTLLDSLDAIVWQITTPDPKMQLAFIPVIGDSFAQNRILNNEHDSLFISPEEPNPEAGNFGNLVSGFRWLQISPQRAAIFCVLNTSSDKVKSDLGLLAKTYEKNISDRRERITKFLSINDVVTNIPEITDAIQWAQISLDALVSEKTDTGIWAGIPDVPKYRGRDSFISLTGAFLCTGKFDQARQILSKFAKNQLTNSDDTWFGRIPTQISKHEISYNGADVTWWFIRDVYEYILYSGDTEFAAEIFPTVKTALMGALRYRMDEKFLLRHQELETWMGGYDFQLSPVRRGNRAVEIQALWYTALQIGSKLANLNGEKSLSEHWITIARETKKNFLSYYWNDYSFRMYDHLKPDGSTDNMIRPNQIFTVTMPDLPGIEPLVSDEAQAYVTNQVTNKLTFRLGVSSLWLKSSDFNASVVSGTDQDENTINQYGVIWPWLAGPVISALSSCNYDYLMFELFYNEAIQILDWDAIGNFHQLMAPPTETGQINPVIAGSVSHAKSLAEFTRNFYQDIIGFKPNALVNVVQFKPVFTEELSFISANLPMAGQLIHFEGERSEQLTSFNISAINITDTLRVILNFPGYDRSYYNLTRSEPGIVIQYENADRFRYRKYDNLDWFFVQLSLLSD